MGGTLRWAWKSHFLIQYKKKLIISGDLFFLLKRSSLWTSDIQGCYSPKGITYMIYTLIHGRDPIPWRITYIEYRSQVNIHQFFGEQHPIPLVFIATSFCFHSSTTPVVGGSLRWAWKTHFLIQYQKKLIISGDVFFVETFYSDVKVDAQNLEWRHLCHMQNAGDRWLNCHSKQVSCAMYP